MDTEKFENRNVGQAEESFDTTGLLLNFLANWKWFVLSVFICLIVAYFYGASRIPMYQVDATMYLSDDQNSSKNAFNMGNVASDPMVALKNYIDETELEILKSKNNLVKIVDSLGLSYSYYRKGFLRNYPLYENNAVVVKMSSQDLKNLKSPIFVSVSPSDNVCDIKIRTNFNDVEEKKDFADVTLPVDIELSHGTLHIERSPVVEDFSDTEEITILSPRERAGQISQQINIEFAKKSDKIIRISLTTDVKKKGVDIIGALIDFYNKDIIEDKNRSAVQTEAFILDRLVMISDELKDVENRLQDYRQAHNVTDITMQSTLNLNLQSDYEQQKSEIEAEMAIVEEIERIVSNADSYETLPAAINNPTITNIIENYNRKVGQLNRALEGSTADNPLVLSMRDELTRDKARILQNLATHKRNLSTKRNSIKTLENRSSGMLASTPSVDKGLQEIFREQQVKVNIYTFLLQRREEIALQKTLATNTARLIDDPEGIGPVSPRKIMIYAVAFLIGLLIPACFIFLKRLLFPTFADQDELQRLTKQPVLGEICMEGSGDSDGIVVKANTSTPIIELFRLLRTSISFTKGGSDVKTILVTSAISGEGKTFVAANLAMTYALMGKKTLVIGLDLRRPLLAKHFGFDNKFGVTTYLSGQSNDLQSLIRKTRQCDDLDILTAGPVPPNPNELIMSDRTKDMFEQLRREYDYIIVDSAPIGIISDSMLLTHLSDIQLFVTRANYTSTNSLKLLQNAVDTGILPHAYIVINGVNIASNSYIYRRYGDYGNYGKKAKVYGYGYSYNRTDDKKHTK